MAKKRINPLIATLAFVFLAAGLWTLRSWNLDIGDGEFCCKQTVGEKAFAVTLSRSFLSYALYRILFFTLHPILDWWVEDIIALSSCAAGLVFFYALFRLAQESAENKRDFWIVLLFPSTTLLLQIFCGHVEFYPWTCALLMLCAWLSWRTIYHQKSVLWASTAMALAGGFHSSGIFYFPALLLLPMLMHKTDGEPLRFRWDDWKPGMITLAVFLAAALLHRKPTHWAYVALCAAGLVWYFSYCPAAKKARMDQWVKTLLPWLVLFAVRAVLRLRAEPLLEHLPPFREPYDHGAYLYMAFSWDHLYDKVVFHLWLAPFGLIALIGFGVFWRRIASDRWLLFLANFCIWTLVWSILFYPQLRTRDWDLFATIAIPLNLFAVYAGWRILPRGMFRWLAAATILVHLSISLPIVLSNSSLLKGRGYVTVAYDPKPVAADAYIRGLKLGVTPIHQNNIRSGKADVRIVPLERGYLSWSEDVILAPGKTYRFDPILEKAGLDIHPPIPEKQ
ncbi:MAG: hypothetical protein JXR73_14975 [Candidatus Omnitrophica bacterium]|nr:hypothetical protein [Candidatus Omnitrophota bacterium]